MITRTFVTRYVADHPTAEAWYARFVGRPADESPVPNCREWHLPGGVVLQVIHQPDRAGQTSFAFVVDDLDGDLARLADDGLVPTQDWEVAGFDRLRYVEFSDPEQVQTGLLDDES